MKLDHNLKCSFPRSFVDWIILEGIENFQHSTRDFEIFRNGQKTYEKISILLVELKPESGAENQVSLKILNLKMFSNHSEMLKNRFPVKFCIDIGILVSLGVTKSLSALVRPPSLRL